MNRTVLIIICDFLLLTLIATARLDRLPSVSEGPMGKLEMESYQQPQRQAPRPQPGAMPPRTSDLLETMKSSLEEERQSREKLSAVLTRTEQAYKAEQQVAAERAQQLAAAQQSLRAREEEARRLEQARSALANQFAEAQTNYARMQEQMAQTAEQARAYQKQLEQTAEEARKSQERLKDVQQQYQAAQANLGQMEKQLSSTSAEAQAARDRLAKLDEELKTRQAEAEQARKRIDEAEKQRQAVELEKTRIAGDLKVAETQKQFTQQQLEQAKSQINVVQQEKAQIQKVATELAQGVVTFAEKQGELAKEIRENRPLTANTIYADFVTNRIDADFRANRSGLFGRSISKNSTARSILVTDGREYYSIYHIQDTPFRFEEFSKEWERFVVQLFRGLTSIPVSQVSFLSIDPRVVVAPLGETQAKQLGVKIYKVSNDPLKFNDALLVGADEGYYGECRFTLVPEHTNYLKMERSALGRLVGKFNPSRGDLVFAKSGELIGIMVNKEYCSMLTSFVPQATIPTGTNLNGEAIGARLSQMQSTIMQLPPGLQ